MKTLVTADELRNNHQDADVLLNALRHAHEARALEMRSMLDRADAASRNLLASESREYAAHETELRKLSLTIDEVESQQKAVTQARSRFVRMGGATERSKYREDNERVRAFLRGEERTLEVDFTGVRHHVDPSTGRVEVRDLTKGTSTAGGDTVVTSFSSRLWQHMVETSAILRTNVTIYDTDSGEDFVVPKTTSHSTASIVTEGAAISESDPAFSRVTLQAYKYGHLVQSTFELLNDTAVDLVGYLAQDAGRAIGNAFGAHAITGTGTGQPNGIVTASTVGVTGATGNSGVPTTNELIDLFYSVIEPYRSRGFWLFSTATANEIRKLKDSNGQYMWAPGMQAGEPPQLLGRPVVVDPNVADATTSAKSVVFGDISAYAIRRAGSVRFERSDDYAFANDLTTFRALARLDGDLVDTTGAIKLFQGGAS